MTRAHLIAVGACAVDNILTVPYFPEEDSKLRALSLTKRRGGNCPNSLEVLLQLTNGFAISDFEATSALDDINTKSSVCNPKLSLIATLPARSSPQMPFMASSFDTRRDVAGNDVTQVSLEDSAVDLSRCIYREDYIEPVSSYIICSQAASSRTIVNHNELPEMTFDEFVEATRDILPSATSSKNKESDTPTLTWFHFEGRTPQTTLKCIQHLRGRLALNSSTESTTLQISVELEKPGREGLQELAFEADVVFYSKSWAEAEGYENAETCLKEQAKIFLRNDERESVGDKLLICTWNDQGACALQLPGRHNHPHPNHGDPIEQQAIHSEAYIDQERPVLDTVGAGDTFIAGMLFGLICRSQRQLGSDQSTVASGDIAAKRQPVWSLKQQLDFANGLAGQKVLQHGFQGLGRNLQGLVRSLDDEVVD